MRWRRSALPRPDARVPGTWSCLRVPFGGVPRRRMGAVHLAAAAALLAAPLPAHAQANEGALFLLAPVGARAVGMGQAVATDQTGSESIWWNPAGIARLDEPEAALHHSTNIFATGDAVAFLYPSSLIGVLALAANIVNYGEEEAVDQSGNRTGTIVVRNVSLGGTYATAIGSRLSAGLTYKIVQLRVDCTGSCGPFGSSVASTSALDAGLQYQLPGIPVTAGLAARNVGLRLQVKDEGQSDPLPTRIQAGLSYRVPAVSRATPDAALIIAGDVIDEVSFDSPAARLGAELGWQKRVALRAGYVIDESESDGPSIGFGLRVGDFIVDFARVFEEFSSATEPPTYLSLRYLF